jgi:hypothetical protein
MSIDALGFIFTAPRYNAGCLFLVPCPQARVENRTRSKNGAISERDDNAVVM